MSTWVHAWPVSHKFLNHHCCIRVMEMMWDIPLSLNRWPNQFPDIHHVQPFYKPFEPESQPFHPPWPGKGNFALALRRRNKRISPRKKIHSLLSYKCASREEFSIKDQKKAKEKKNIPDQDRKKAKKKREKIPDQRSKENKRNMQKGLRTRQYLKK